MVSTRSKDPAAGTKKKADPRAASTSAPKKRTKQNAARAKGARTKQDDRERVIEESKQGENWKWEHSAEIEEYERQKKLPKTDWDQVTDVAVLRARIIELEAIVTEKNKTIKYMERDYQRREAGYDPIEEWNGPEEDCPPDSDEWSD